MLFNSFEYLLFLVTVFGGFWFLFRNNYKLQNFFLLCANYVFYLWWDWRFLFLIVFVSLVNFSGGLLIGESIKETANNNRRAILVLVLVVNLLFLGFFKYFNFFSKSAFDLLNLFGFKTSIFSLNIILPIGISFYTFQAMSYTIDVYASKIKPSKDILSFFAYLSFFPLILAGPIERAGNLLTQFTKKREFVYDEAVDGMRQILIGLFKKIVIADNCAVLVNSIFDNYETQPSSVLVMGAVYFAFQIYGDFSGYSDIAIGSAKLLGFKLMTNFRTPYFSRNIMEFWRRWHISLSTWFRDYLFLPIAYSLTRKLHNQRYFGIKKDKVINILATITTFIICGLWHGANWTFVVWGGLIGIYFIPLILRGTKKKNTEVAAQGKLLPSFREALQILTTFGFVCIAWVFFRAKSLHEAAGYLKSIFANRFLPDDFAIFFPRYMLLLLLLFVLGEWFLLRYDDYLERFRAMHIVVRRAIYVSVMVLIFLFIQNEATTFIYFQF